MRKRVITSIFLSSPSEVYQKSRALVGLFSVEKKRERGARLAIEKREVERRSVREKELERGSFRGA